MREEQSLKHNICPTLNPSAAFKNSRCLIPISGWYEWKEEDGIKQPYYFFNTSQSLLFAAGLYWNRSSGDIETSIMLAIAPDLVDRKKTQDYPSQQSNYIRRFKHLRAYGQHAFGWKMKDLNEQGVVGHATRAKPEKGHQILDHAFKGICELIEDMIAFDTNDLK